MRNKAFITVLLIALILFFFIELIFGKYPVAGKTLLQYLSLQEVSVTDKIILESRFVRALTASIGGASLALSGLLMQTYFRNALAGPSVLGISSGSSLAVAIFTMAAGGWGLGSLGLDFGLTLAAFLGAIGVLLILMILSRFVRNSVSLLILGLMIGYLTSAMIGVLQFNASEVSLKAFVVWGLGSFANTDVYAVWVLGMVFIVSLIILLFIFKHLNVLLLGEEYASSLGVRVRSVKMWMIVITGLLVGVVTAYCGPISFLGLAVPHLARGIFKSSNHFILVPGVLLVGAGLGLACDIISKAPWYDGGLPLNTVTSLVGAPVVIYYLVRKSKMGEMV